MRAALILLLSFVVSAAFAAPPPEFSDADAVRALELIKSGLETHRAPVMLSAFDQSADGFADFADSINAWFNQIDTFRLRYHLTEAAPTADGQGAAVVDLQLEAIPLNGESVRRNAQVRFNFQYRNGAWKIVDISPREFFS